MAILSCTHVRKRLSAIIIYCYCLQRLIASLKFVNTKRDNYLSTLNCTEVHVACDEQLMKLSGRGILTFKWILLVGCNSYE